MLFNSKTRGKGPQYIFSVSLVLLVALGCFLSTDLIGNKAVAFLLLTVVSIEAMFLDIFPVLLAATLSAVIWNLFFIPPLYTFHIGTAEDLLTLLLFFLISILNALLTFKIRSVEKITRDKEEKVRTLKLYDTLLNSLSHELKTPISTIIGAVDTLKEQKAKLSEQNQSELLNQIDTASLRLNRQVENLLNMSRLETGSLKLKLDWVDMPELVYGVIQKLLEMYPRTIQFDAQEPLPLFKLDRGLIEQVLYNLLHNAILYTPNTTTIYIRVAHQKELCLFEVEDEGPGIPEEAKQWVFQKFYRLANKTGGSGLGLSIVKGFVEAHEGNIFLENNAYGGATFKIEIPAEASYLNHLKNE